MKTVIAIPARYESSRFPGKPLVMIGGLPMIVKVWKQAMKAKSADRVIVATDDQRIFDVVAKAGGEVVMTDPLLPSGTDRIYAALDSVQCEIVVNLQGDEPMIDPDHIDTVIEALKASPGAQVATLATPITHDEDLWNRNTVKVLLDINQMAVYFSRTPVPQPFSRDTSDYQKYLRHIGIYAYRMPFLKQFIETQPAWSELTERLEQLRVLHLGEKIAVKIVQQVFPGVDTPEDLQILEQKISRQGFV